MILWRLRGEIWGYTKFGSPPPRLETLCNMRLARSGGTKLLLTVHILGNEMEHRRHLQTINRKARLPSVPTSAYMCHLQVCHFVSSPNRLARTADPRELNVGVSCVAPFQRAALSSPTYKLGCPGTRHPTIIVLKSLHLTDRDHGKTHCKQHLLHCLICYPWGYAIWL